MRNGMFGAIHGEFVVPKDGGGFQTVATQTGEATAVDGDSITVKSEDGFSKTYVVNDTTRVNAGKEGVSAIKVGDTVYVSATVDGDTATANVIVDASRPVWPKWRGMGGKHMRMMPGVPAKPSAAPTDSPPAPGTPETVSPTA